MRMAAVMLVGFLVGFISSVQSQNGHASDLGQAACPLDFSNVQKPSQSCSADPDLSMRDNFTTSQCCYATFANFAAALAMNTNKSNGQLFLNATEEAACARLARKLSLVSDDCDVAPPVFTAHEGPCLFATEKELEVNLTSNPAPVPLTDLITTCADVQQEQGCEACRAIFKRGETKLIEGTKSNIGQINCRAALLVSITSHNFTAQAWQHALYSCLEVPYAVASPSGKRLKQDHTTILGIILGSVVFLGLLAIAGYLRYRRVVATKDGYCSEDGNLMPSGERMASDVTLYNFSAKELVKATNNFNDDNFIGEGNAGKVYRGTLPSGQLVAIKLIMNEKKLDTFYKEIENLSRVRHPNLVTLLGYCQAADQHLLVYEYCPKGNLWYYLFGDGEVLTWEQRISIAVGSARGLMHLHMNPCGYIVHRDIKPTNILLTEGYDAKVSDFGLSRFIAIDESCVFTEVKGTAGYLDPEYLSLGTLTFSSDVYSFGIVLLQLISARRPIDLDKLKRLPLVKMANHVLTGGGLLSDLVDPRLEGAYSEAALRKVAELAVQCTSNYALHRPSMIEVRQMLEEAWSLSKPTSLASSKMAQGGPWLSPPGRSLGNQKPPANSWEGSLEFQSIKDASGR